MSAVAGTPINEVESKFFHRIFVGFAILATLSLAINLLGRELGSRIALGGHTDDRTMHEVIIANDVLEVPANMIRYPEQRRDGVANRMDLYVEWPSMKGYSTAEKALFNNSHESGKKLMFITLEQRTLSRDMSGRFVPIYKSMISEPGIKLTGGLTQYKLPEKSGFMDENLVVGPTTGERPFVARCLDAQKSKDSITSCERDIHVGDDLTMMVRFPASLLIDWETLDRQLATFASTIVRTAK